ncbi:heme exporter protein CcmB [Achromobacter xylosoxidans]|uniref:heme exporter protein CcmB n=1 Tax=Alcaligenes xylosoxydans xylosoxydans TaxID=85698 RepID=UPI000B490033|nr:heme exporter protein CcmB [Achromobacter xylosoxidans]
MPKLLSAVALRDLRIAQRRASDTLTPLAFFLVAASLFPLAVGPEREILRAIAPGVLWVMALLSCLMSLGRLFEADHRDGSLEQLMLCAAPLPVIVLGKVAAHWLLSGLPLTLLAPVLGLQFGLDAAALLFLTLGLAIGTPALGLIGAIGAALTLTARGGGALLALLVLPLFIPILIFGAGAVQAAQSGLGASAHLSLLGAVLALSLFFAPLAAAAAIRISLE